MIGRVVDESKSQMDMNILSTVKEQLQQDVRRLSEQRGNIIIEIANAKKEVEREKSRLHAEFQAFQQAQDKLTSGQANELSTREQNLMAWSSQLTNREAQISSLEQQQADLDVQKRKLAQDYLELERLRTKTQAEYEKADSIRHEIESRQEVNIRLKEQNALKLIEIKQREDALVNGEASLDQRLKTVEVREKSVDEASKAIQPKLAEIQAREDALQVRERIELSAV